MMRKLVGILVMFFVFGCAGGVFAQQSTMPVQKQPTMDELQWQLKSIQNEFLYLQERMKTLQGEHKQVQDAIKAMGASNAPAVKPPATSIPEKSK